MKKRVRVSYNLKPETINLVKLASEIFNEDMSSIVDSALQFRLSFITKKLSNVKKNNQEINNEEWFENFWNNAKKEINKK